MHNCADYLLKVNAELSLENAGLTQKLQDAETRASKLEYELNQLKQAISQSKSEEKLKKTH
jgi:regulator of replication initiation timing